MLAAILSISSSARSRPHLAIPRDGLGWFGAFLALAVFWTWPLTAHLSSRIPHDLGDPVLNIWLLWWNAHAVPFTDRWWNPPIFHPMRGALALSEHLAGQGIVTTPVQLLGASALTAYNVALILSFALSGFFAFLLVRRLAGSSREAAVRDAAALCAALAYGFGPYRAGQLAHLQVLTSQWMPLALLAMHGYLEDGRRRWLGLFAAAWLVQALSNGYYLLFFPVLIALWLGWFVDWRRAPARGFTLAITWCAASLPLLPVLLKYAAVQRSLGLARTSGEMALFSAKPASFLHASGMLAFWPSAATGTTEEFLFPGITPVALVMAGFGASGFAGGRRTWKGSPFVFYTGAALLMWALALGPAPPGTTSFGWLRPYTLLTFLPGFDALRVPARFAMLATLCLATASGLAFARIAPRRRVHRMVLATAVVAGLAVDGWMQRMPLAAPPGRVALPEMAQAAVLELPVDEGAVGTAAMYRSMTHHQPLVNGYSGHTPPHFAILSIALRRGDPSVFAELARRRPLVIFANASFDPHGSLRSLVEGLPGIQARGGTSAGSMFVLPRMAASRVAPAGEPWTASVRASEPDQLELDLGATRTVRTIGFPLRWHYAELDRRLAIEASVDGKTWATVWEDWTGGPALAAALEDPLEAPVRLTIPDVPMRYLRVHPAPLWMRRELRAYAPR